MTLSKRRPPIRLILLAMLLIAMATPLVGLFFLRVIENQFVRRTEAELIGQSAALSAVIAERIQLYRLDDAWFGPRARGRFDPRLRDRFIPMPPRLDLAASLLPPRPAVRPALSPPHPDFMRLGASLEPLLRATRRRTLAGLLVLDAQGRILTGRGIGGSLAHVEEVRAALDGDYASRIRTRLREKPPPLVYSFTKGASLRVFTAFPIVVRGRVAGVIYASRTPRHILQIAAEERDKLIFAGFAMAGMLGLFFLIARRALTSPIHALTERTRAIAAGDRSAMRPLARHGTAEVAELSEIFLRTARRLHDRSDDLAAFAAHVSHELKSPLTAIQGAAELIRDAEADMSAEERAAFLNNIIKDTERLALLVRRLLELARADAREDDLGETAVADLAGAIRAPIEVEIRDPDAPRLSISAEKLGIVLTNLADNAARHGAGRVSIDVARKGDEAVITVSDDGEGISPANRAKVFEPFFTTRRTAGGTGMGLPIIKALIEARDGSIALGPPAPGATFVITLPLAA